MFGKPVNGFDLFQGVMNREESITMQTAFLKQFSEEGMYFGSGAYFNDDPATSFAYSHRQSIFVSSVILGVVNDTHYHTPVSTPICARSFKPDVDSLKGRVLYCSTLKGTDYVVYRFGQCKPTYWLRFEEVEK